MCDSLCVFISTFLIILIINVSVHCQDASQVEAASIGLPVDTKHRSVETFNLKLREYQLPDIIPQPVQEMEEPVIRKRKMKRKIKKNKFKKRKQEEQKQLKKKKIKTTRFMKILSDETPNEDRASHLSMSTENETTTVKTKHNRKPLDIIVHIKLNE